MRIHIAYATKEGQTAKIADYIAEVVRAQGHQADIGTRPRKGGCSGRVRRRDRRVLHPHGKGDDKHAAEYVRYNRGAWRR